MGQVKLGIPVDGFLKVPEGPYKIASLDVLYAQFVSPEEDFAVSSSLAGRRILRVWLA